MSGVSVWCVWYVFECSLCVCVVRESGLCMRVVCLVCVVCVCVRVVCVCVVSVVSV